MFNNNDKPPSFKTDWEKCCLCQTKTNEELRPRPTYSINIDSYRVIASNVPHFLALNCMPLKIDPARLDEGDGIENTLRKNNAKYHKNCYQLFNNSKLERAKKRQSETDVQNIEDENKKIKRRSIELQHCFLCEKMEPVSEIRHAMTENINKRLNECAHNLNDSKLLALLSGGDAVAQELKYHCACLVSLYNKERSHLAKRSSEATDPQSDKQYQMVFSELVVYICETKRSSTHPNVIFQLADLVNLCNSRLTQLGEEHTQVNRTRLKEQLLEHIPGLEAFKKGRDVVLAFRDDVGPMISTASKYSNSEEMILANAANILRKKMLNHKRMFEGKLDEIAIFNSIPPSLLQFVCMIEHGVDIESQLQFGSTTTDLALAQLLQYNCFQKTTEDSTTKRHSRDRETPFPIFTGLSIYAKTRKSTLVDMLHEHGLSISYKRVLDITAQLGDSIVKDYVQKNVVCPSQLKKGIFSTGAMDNIDHNPSSTTTSTSFHGTSMSVFQHVTDVGEGEDYPDIQIQNKQVKRVPELPDSYTDIQPAFLDQKNPPPLQTDVRHAALPSLALRNEYEWLEHVYLQQKENDNINITWAAHHATKQRGLKFGVSISALMPLLRDEAHSVSTVKHCMDKIREVIAHVNPSQTPVMTADQPLYTIAKQIQWHWPEQYGEDKFIIMLGGLHIEMAALRSLGSILRGSGWTGVLAQAEVVSSGTAESLLSASNVTKTRQIHQVTASCLYTLQKEAFSKQCSEQSDPEIDFQRWCEKRKEESPQFQFWDLVLNMQLVIFSFVRSLREANFNLYCEVLANMIPFFFANNNVKYARWLSIHLRDMMYLEKMHPDVYQEFQKGKFVVHKSMTEFSGLAIDQAHEQANAVIKGDGGAIGITEDASALRRWMVAGPEVSRLVGQYELASQVKLAREDVRHHEEARHLQRLFSDQVQKLHYEMQESGNPFLEETADLINIDQKTIAHPTAADLIKTHLSKGQTAFAEFFDRLNDSEAFYSPIKKNNIDFFNQADQKCLNKSKKQILKDDYRLFSQLFISCQLRECDLQEFFRHENQSFPASLSNNGNLLVGKKSQLIEMLEVVPSANMQIYEEQINISDYAVVADLDVEKSPDGVVIDGSALVHSLVPRRSKTFEEYADHEVVPKIKMYSEKYQRTDIVFDVYKASSLKAEARSRRGQGFRRKVTGKTKLPSSWYSFLRDDSNKTELFEYLADRIISLCESNLVVVTKKENCQSNRDVDLALLNQCNHEEADSRIFLHALHAVSQQHMVCLLIKANDTDVIVLAITVFEKLREAGLQMLWLEFGKDSRWMPIHLMAANLGLIKARGLPFFHAFTGCDVVSAIRGKGKKTAWKIWDMYPEITPIFTKLSTFPVVIDEDDMKAIEKFVVLLYDKNSSHENVNECRFDLFARKQ